MTFLVIARSPADAERRGNLMNYAIKLRLHHFGYNDKKGDFQRSQHLTFTKVYTKKSILCWFYVVYPKPAEEDRVLDDI